MKHSVRRLKIDMAARTSVIPTAQKWNLVLACSLQVNLEDMDSSICLSTTARRRMVMPKNSKSYKS